MNYRLYASGYTEAPSSKGVFSIGFDETELWEIDSLCGLQNPSFIEPAGSVLYAVEELLGEAAVACVAVSPEGKLNLSWKRPVPGSGLCHITLAASHLFASGYAGGTLTGLHKDGAVCFYREFAGSGPNARRQEKAHIHSSLPTPDGSRLLAADLGTDRLYQFVIGPEGGLIPDEAQPWVQTKPGRGPRHFAFHPNGKWFYLVAELSNSLLTFRYENHRLEQTGEYPLLIPGDPDTSLAADVHLSGEGQFVYVSVRGADCLWAFRVMEEGRLEPVERVSSGGGAPRSFALSPNGRYVAAANQDSGLLTIFARDAETGTLKENLCTLKIPQVSCVKWAE